MRSAVGLNGLSGIFFIIQRLTITIKSLSATPCASLNITTFDVKLAFNYCTVVARATISTPIIIFIAVANT